MKWYWLIGWAVMTCLILSKEPSFERCELVSIAWAFFILSHIEEMKGRK